MGDRDWDRQAFKFDIRCISDDDDDDDDDDGRSVHACSQSASQLGHFPVIIIIMLRVRPAANFFSRGSDVLGGHFVSKPFHKFRFEDIFQLHENAIQTRVPCVCRNRARFWKSAFPQPLPKQTWVSEHYCRVRVHPRPHIDRPLYKHAATWDSHNHGLYVS